MYFIIYSGYMGPNCTTYGVKEKYVQWFGKKNLKKRGNLEDLGTDVSMILKCICKKSAGRACTEFICFGIGASE
jgi:hypothetical protein